MKEVNHVFGALEEPDVEALMRIGTQQQLHVSDQLLTEGDDNDAIYLVLDGELSVSVKARNSAIAYVGKGEIVGEMSLLEIVASIGHAVRDHPSNGAPHPSRRSREEPRR
jgi:CRP-like cAMP-binding protein